MTQYSPLTLYVLIVSRPAKKFAAAKNVFTVAGRLVVSETKSYPSQQCGAIVFTPCWRSDRAQRANYLLGRVAST